jgi:hypothetical protein
MAGAEQMRSILVTDIKNFSLSADGREATFALVTRYAGELAVTLPAGCLQNLKLPTQASPAAPPGAEAVAGHKPNGGGADGPGGAVAALKVNGKEPGALSVSVPKKWMTMTDTQKHGLVIIAFDPQTPSQTGFALVPQAARELAAALLKHADTAAAAKPAE